MVGTTPTIIDAATTLTGQIEGGELIEVYGKLEGELAATHVIVHHGGSIIGTVNAKNAHIHGVMQGEVTVSDLMDIGPTGAVSGKVTYGALAMAQGGELEASVHNVPPTLTGDLDLSVVRGRSVAITTKDLNAVDPDDAASDLTFSISNAANGWLARTSETTKPIQSFTKADLLANRIAFVHDGAAAATAGFAVKVTDAQGATSGRPAHIQITVQ